MVSALQSQKFVGPLHITPFAAKFLEQSAMGKRRSAAALEMGINHENRVEVDNFDGTDVIAQQARDTAGNTSMTAAFYERLREMGRVQEIDTKATILRPGLGTYVVLEFRDPNPDYVMYHLLGVSEDVTLSEKMHMLGPCTAALKNERVATIKGLSKGVSLDVVMSPIWEAITAPEITRTDGIDTRVTVTLPNGSKSTIVEIGYSEPTIMLDYELTNAYTTIENAIRSTARQITPEEAATSRILTAGSEPAAQIPKAVRFITREEDKLERAYLNSKSFEQIRGDKPTLEEYAASGIGGRIGIKQRAPPELRHFFRSYALLDWYQSQFQGLLEKL